MASAPRQPSRGYALILVLMVLALLSVGLGTLFVYQEGSATTTGSLLERRRVFYACDGIGRAATVLAQGYMTTAAPSTQGLIDSVCTSGGGGCCATTASTSTDPTAGSCEAVATAASTRLTAAPTGPGPSALPLITPSGFKIVELSMASGRACTTNNDCPFAPADGSPACVSNRCNERVVAPLPNGPFEGMNARQDTFAMGLTAEHVETTRFRCATEQTITLGKIAMFQFFLFSDMSYTDWHPGPIMRTSGRMHANGNLGLDNNVRIARVTAAGDIGCIGTPPAVNIACTEADVRISTTGVASMNDALYVAFTRNANWDTEALTRYNRNALDRAHGVPRLQLPIVGSPEVQRGRDALNGVTPNANDAVVNGVPRRFSNSRLLVDPVRTADTDEIRAQKFAFKADLRIINGVWYLRDVSNPTSWPGIPIWSDHGGLHVRTAADDLVAGGDVGQETLTTARAWAGRVPHRFSYYGTAAGSPRLARDLDVTSPLTLRPNVGTRAVVSYGALFRDGNGTTHASTYRPGLRTRLANNRHAFCSAKAAAGDAESVVMLDALAFDDNAITTGADRRPASCGTVSQAAALLGGTRSGFRDGWREIAACGNNDSANDNPANCDRAAGNVLPMNFDVAAFQEALGDTTTGELGSYFSNARPFNGIVWIAAPYPGSEDGYGADGGAGIPSPPPTPRSPATTAPSHLRAAPGTAATSFHDNPLASDSAWTAAASSPLSVDLFNEGRDDEIAALPFPLCSDAGGTAAAGTDMSSRGGHIFRRPDCGDAATYSRINGVRIHNARRINSNQAPTVVVAAGADGTTGNGDDTIANADLIPGGAVAGANRFSAVFTDPPLPAPAVGRLPNGLTIITNLPVYMLGDANLTSDAWAPVTATGTHWVPFLVGGDVVHPVSNAWDDANVRWARSNGRDGDPRQNPDRVATVTRWHWEMLSGWGPSVAGPDSGGILNFPRALETWSGCTGFGGTAFAGGCPAIMLGSMIIGHVQVYSPRFSENGIGRTPPRRDWGFDDHLLALDRQPPGAPLFDVAAIRQWSRQ